jgi:hypothetical protein
MYNNAPNTSTATATVSSANDDQFDFSVSANVNEQLEALIGQREDWSTQNAELLARSNKRLYQILSTIYNMGWVINNKAHPNQNIQEKFDAYCKEGRFTFNKDTNYFVRICKVVFGKAEGSRYSAYGNALNAAYTKNVPMGGLIEFFNEVGGVEEARRLKLGVKTSTSVRSLADKANQLIDHVTSKSAARIDDPAICKLVDRHQANGIAVLLVSIADDGALIVHSVSQADSIVNRVVLQTEKDAPKSAANSEEANKTEAA